jgi:vancomycin resistance protein VanW
LGQWVTQPQRYAKARISSAAHLRLQHRVAVSWRGVQSHPDLEAGKRINLAIAAAHFDGRCIDAATPFSFWRILGKPTAARGYRAGTEIRDGCVVPSIGGGLCLISGALFRLAAEMDWEILERHGHTVQSRDLSQIDATVFWPQVDLRFAPRVGTSTLRVRMQHELLVVESYGAQATSPVRVWREAVEPENNNLILASRVVRASAGRKSDVLGLDHKRDLPSGLKRNCITCEEQGCSARESNLRVML